MSLTVFSLVCLCAAQQHLSASNVEQGTKPAPSIQFMRPVKGERFFDFPIFIQVDVSGFHLVPSSEERSKSTTDNTGYICYSLDDYPVYATEDTQLMIGKFTGDFYVPVGTHVLKAQLVDVNGKPLNPPVLAITSISTGHPAVVESNYTETGVQKAESIGHELSLMRTHLNELKKELARIKNGTAGFVLDPGSAGTAGSE